MINNFETFKEVTDNYKLLLCPFCGGKAFATIDFMNILNKKSIFKNKHKLIGVIFLS